MFEKKTQLEFLYKV